MKLNRCTMRYARCRLQNMICIMERSLVFCLFLIFSLILLPEWTFAYEVTVKLTNGTDPEKSVEGQVLTLHLLKEKDGSPDTLRKVKGESDSEGIATFVLKGRESETHLGVTAKHRGVTYRTQLVPIEEGKDKYELSFKVYEISDDENLVFIKERRVFIQSIKDGVLNLIEGLTIANNGNKSYVGRFNEKSQ